MIFKIYLEVDTQIVTQLMRFESSPGVSSTPHNPVSDSSTDPPEIASLRTIEKGKLWCRYPNCHSYYYCTTYSVDGKFMLFVILNLFYIIIFFKCTYNHISENT